MKQAHGGEQRFPLAKVESFDCLVLDVTLSGLDEFTVFTSCNCQRGGPPCFYKWFTCTLPGNVPTLLLE